MKPQSLPVMLAYDQERLAHAEFRDQVHGHLDGKNIAYRFEQVYPVKY